MFYLVRHGEPDYSERNEKIYRGFGANMCPLSSKGREQIIKTAKDKRLQGADIILSSPYTRTLQTAAILSKELQIDIIVETDLHEWVANKNYIYEEDEIAVKNYNEYIQNKGIYPNGVDKDWESNEIMKIRFFQVLEKYKQYDKVIVASHGTLMSAVTGLDRPAHGEIYELDF
ncbi:MAG: histidine phosphatase family protein [Ruminococcus sp.]|nr:histidine phosphatase family protein [Ruminococcus sp.]